MAKQKKQDRNRQQKNPAGERSRERTDQGGTESEQPSGSPADMARKQQKKQSFGHN